MANWKDVQNYIETKEPLNPVPEGAEVVPVVGVSFVEDYPKNLHELAKLQQARIRYVSLMRNPENRYDKNAVEVRYHGKMLGHLPREVAARIAPLLDAGKEIKASVYQVRISPENPNNPGLDILLEDN